MNFRLLSNIKQWHLWLSPTRYLTLANIASAAIGFLMAAYVARIVGPSRLGLIAVISGINTSIVALVDVRLTDVAAKTFYQVNGVEARDIPAYRTGVLWLAWLGTGLLAIIMALVSALIGNLLVPLFTETGVARWWLPLGAVTIAFDTMTNTLMFLLRFGKAFFAIGTWRVILQIMRAGIIVLILTMMPNIDGVYLSQMAGALTVLIAALIVSWHQWTRRVNLPLLQPDWQRAYAAYRRSLNVVFYGNLLGYAKLFQRSADVLLVAYFTNDRETGIYKLARSLIDQGLAILQDALYQVYYPNFLGSFARRAKDEYRRLASRLLRIASLITVGLLVGEALLLPLFIKVVFPAYTGVEWPMMILSATFIFIVGFHPWLWAIFVASGSLRAYTAAVSVSVVVQYAASLILFYLVEPSALMAMIGMLVYYLWLTPITYWLILRHWAEFIPFGLGLNRRDNELSAW